MKISIYNFKSIDTMKDLEISKVNLMAGVNSAGKSSVSQLLLILKQSLMSEVTSEALLNNGPYIRTASWDELIHDKVSSRSFGFELNLTRSDISNPEHYDQMLEHADMQDITISAFFEMDRTRLITQKFEVKVSGCAEENVHMTCTKTQRKKADDKLKYMIISTVPGFKPAQNRGYFITFSSMFPLFFEDVNREGDNLINNTELIPVSKIVKETLTAVFNKIYYIGPERNCGEGKMQSYTSMNFENVGNNGEYTRFILNQKRDVKVNDTETLAQAVNRWLCGTWQLARSIESVKLSQNTYQVVLVDNRGIKTDLWQVGFGIGQVLPIIVQGLLCPADGLLIVDSPEIHLHPMVQGGLMDFFIEMAAQHKNVLVETHSDHIITRLRRRVAEKKISTEDVNIYFVTQQPDGSAYETVMLGEQGSIDNTMPAGFLDTLDEDFRAILKARLR